MITAGRNPCCWNGAKTRETGRPAQGHARRYARLISRHAPRRRRSAADRYPDEYGHCGGPRWQACADFGGGVAGGEGVVEVLGLAVFGRVAVFQRSRMKGKPPWAEPTTGIRRSRYSRVHGSYAPCNCVRPSDCDRDRHVNCRGARWQDSAYFGSGVAQRSGVVGASV